jgi:hypothetical protein
LSRDIIADTGVADDAADLPFRLVESLVNMWSGQRASEPSTLPENVADACIRVLGVAGSAMPRLRTSTRRQLASHGADWSPRAVPDGTAAAGFVGSAHAACRWCDLRWIHHPAVTWGRWDG